MPTDTNNTSILIAYDGSELAQFAIERAGEELAKDREALVLCVWQPGDVGFIPVGDRELQAAAADEVKQAAEETAEHGASLAREAGFQARSLAVEAAPVWKGIVETAEAESASIIVFGSHRRTGLVGHLLGSVTAATLAHFPRSVLVVQQPS
jgi:nucleotide-binding universal stress UspA family protein